MGCEKRLQAGRVRFAGGRVWRVGQHLLVEPLRCADCQHWRVVHAGAPYLPVVGTQLNGQAAHGYAGIRRERVGTANGETAGHRHACLAEDARSRKVGGLPAGLEVAADAQALGMVLPVAWVMPGLGLEGVDDTLWRQPAFAEPAGGVGKAGACGQHHGADGSQAHGFRRAVQR
ncbi:hypothetical protein D3C81_1519730 [compost metagenome]